MRSYGRSMLIKCMRNISNMYKEGTCRNGTRNCFNVMEMGNTTTAPPSRSRRKLWLGFSVALLMASILLFINGNPPSVQVQMVYPPHDRSKHDGQWMSFTTPFHLHAYSAFWDDRRSLGSLPVVRIMAVAEILDQRRVFCRLTYEGSDAAVVVEATFGAIGMGVGLQGHFLREYVISCPLIDEFIPFQVSLLPSPTAPASFALPVAVPHRPKVKRKFAACISVTYWTHNPFKIIEWMELLKTFGVSKVTVYNNSLIAEASLVFQHYDRLGFVDFRQSHNFLNDSSEYNIHLHMSPVINDCMYRNMHAFKKIIVTDLDEIITPRNHSNYHDMIAAIERSLTEYHPARIYIFSNAYFFTDLPPSDSSRNETSKLWTMKYRVRMPTSPQGYAIKSIIDPQACVNMHNHYCWGLTPLYDKAGLHVDVPEVFGLNQHYKRCHLEKQCGESWKDAIADDTMLRFREVLTNRVKAKLKEIGLV